VLFVEIDKPGAEPNVTPHAVGRLQCHDLGTINLQPGDGVGVLSARLGQVESKDGALVRARLTGCVSQKECVEIETWIAELRDEVLAADIDTSKLLTEPTEEDFRALRLEAPEPHLLEMLHAPLDARELLGVSDRDFVARWSHDEEARRAARNLFYQLLRGDA
jgi:hypothetical protein